ncbi:hypothetical protein N206_06465 [Helicobacter pylori UM111]|nr:hypothetical protein N206_06465 [Helicobacter pylori UM111]
MSLYVLISDIFHSLNGGVKVLYYNKKMLESGVKKAFIQRFSKL